MLDIEVLSYDVERRELVVRASDGETVLIDAKNVGLPVDDQGAPDLSAIPQHVGRMAHARATRAAPPELVAVRTRRVAPRIRGAIPTRTPRVSGVGVSLYQSPGSSVVLTSLGPGALAIHQWTSSASPFVVAIARGRANLDGEMLTAPAFEVVAGQEISIEAGPEGALAVFVFVPADLRSILGGSIASALEAREYAGDYRTTQMLDLATPATITLARLELAAQSAIDARAAYEATL